MNPQCSEPDLQMAVLAEARDAGTLTPDCALHLEGCAACQTAAERMRRMVSTWSADQVDDDAVAAAATRFQARRVAAHAAAGWFDVVPFALAGVAAGYLLLASTGTIGLPWKTRPAIDAQLPTAVRASTAAVASSATPNDSPRFAPVFAATDEGVKWVRARPHIETTRGVAPLVDGLRLQLNQGESASVALADGRASKVEGPCLVEFWSTPMEVGGWRILREESAAEPSVPVAITPTAPAVPESAVPSNKKGGPGSREGGAAAALNETVSSSARDVAGPGANQVSVRAWARAAAALREDDFDAADRAFDELGHALDPATRDAARLARAQLWISRGREAAVRPVLEQLAQSGATPLVRQRAAEFLHR